MARKMKPVHPGEVLKEEFLDPMGIRPGTFARRIGVDNIAVKRIIDGDRSVTADMALRFSMALGTSAELWLNLQSHHDLECARDEKLARYRKAIEPFETERVGV